MTDADHWVEICYSRDGGRNWSNWKRRSIGRVGQYEQRIQLFRLGLARTWIFRIRVSSPRKHDLLGAVVAVERTDD